MKDINIQSQIKYRALSWVCDTIPYFIIRLPIQIVNTLLTQFWISTEMKEEITTCVPRQQLFNLQTYNQMFLSTHTYGQFTTQNMWLRWFKWVDLIMCKSNLLCFSIKFKHSFHKDFFSRFKMFRSLQLKRKVMIYSNNPAIFTVMCF